MTAARAKRAARRAMTLQLRAEVTQLEGRLGESVQQTLDRLERARAYRARVRAARARVRDAEYELSLVECRDIQRQDALREREQKRRARRAWVAEMELGAIPAHSDRLRFNLGDGNRMTPKRIPQQQHTPELRFVD